MQATEHHGRVMSPRRLRTHVAAVCFIATSAGCGKERPVEAPVVDVAIGPLDASARPLVIDHTPSTEASGRDTSPITGRWEGIGRQDDGQTWPLVVELSSTGPGVCAAVEYPTVPCRAQWICTGEDAGVLHARERLLDDSARRCIDNGTMTMHLGPDDALEWTWSGQGQSAIAKLRRVR